MAGNFLPKFMDCGRRCGKKNPNGDYTNDIFDLEERRRNPKVVIYEDKSTKNETVCEEISPKCHETEDIVIRRENNGRKLRRSLSDCRSKPDDPAMRTPPLATGKENLGTHFKKESPAVTLDDILNPIKKADDEELTSPRSRNTITGEGIEGSRGKLEDQTNIDKDAIVKESPNKAPRRPCIRVRQPPGGKSSIVF